MKDLLQGLQEKNLLTIENNKVGVKPHDQYSFTTYPLQENDYILVEPNEYIGLLTQVYMFNEQLDGVVDYIAPIIDVVETEESEIEELTELESGE